MALAPHALTTLARVKTALGITDSSKDDQLEDVINEASAAIESYCNRSFYYETGKVEYLEGYGTSFLMVSKYPLLDVSEVIVRDETTAVDSDSYYIWKQGEEGKIYRRSTWTARMQSAAPITLTPLAGTQQDRYKVTYTGGYITPQQEIDAVGTRTLPYDLEAAAKGLSVSMYLSESRDETIKSEKLLSWAVTYGGHDSGDGSFSLGPKTTSLIAPYLNPSIV